jgi:hypothetical protein
MLLIFFAALAFVSKLAGETIFDNIVKAQQKLIDTDKRSVSPPVKVR